MTSAGIRRLGPGSVAALLTLFLHGLFLVPLVSGPLRGHPARATTGASLTAPRGNQTSPEPMTAWIELSDSSVPAPSERSSPPLSHIQPQQIEPPVLEEGVIDDAPDIQDAVPPYVQYMGQVTARIAHLWAVPTAKRATDFHCRALIQRGPAGEVKDLTLQPCDEDPALKASVLEAIRLATPLPARPDPQSSANVLSLDFAVFAANADGRLSSVQPGTADARL